MVEAATLTVLARDAGQRSVAMIIEPSYMPKFDFSRMDKSSKEYGVLADVKQFVAMPIRFKCQYVPAKSSGRLDVTPEMLTFSDD